MGYTSQLKYKAMELWAEGRSDADVGKALGSQGHTVAGTTVRAWRTRKDPQDWDTFREKVQEGAKREATRILLRRQIDVHVQHFEDWQRVRLALLRTMSMPEKGADGIVVWKQRDLSPAEVRSIASAYREIQRGQRLALGIPDSHTLTETSETEKMSDRANEVLEAVGLSDKDLEDIGDHVAEKIARAKIVDVIPRLEVVDDPPDQD